MEAYRALLLAAFATAGIAASSTKPQDATDTEIPPGLESIQGWWKVSTQEKETGNHSGFADVVGASVRLFIDYPEGTERSRKDAERRWDECEISKTDDGFELRQSLPLFVHRFYSLQAVGGGFEGKIMRQTDVYEPREIGSISWTRLQPKLNRAELIYEKENGREPITWKLLDEAWPRGGYLIVQLNLTGSDFPRGRPSSYEMEKGLYYGDSKPPLTFDDPQIQPWMPYSDLVWGASEEGDRVSVLIAIAKTEPGRKRAHFGSWDFDFDFSVEGPAAGSPVSETAAAAVENRIARPLRLWVRTVHGLEPASHWIEGMPMLVDVGFSDEPARSTKLTLRSGTRSIAVEAAPFDSNAIDPDENPGESWRHFARTPEILATRENDAPGNSANAAGRLPDASDWAELAGAWRSVYRDAELGLMQGWIRVTAQGRVTARHWDPEAKRWKELRLREARILGDRALPAPADAAEFNFGDAPERFWQLELIGEGAQASPAANADTPPRQRLRLVDGESDSISLEGEEIDGIAPVQWRQPVDRQQIRLELRSTSENTLDWSWSYVADRLTGRDADGGGRTGQLLPPDPEDASVLIMAGHEAWTRASPQIVGAICLDDQLALEPEREFYGSPVERYRFAVRKRLLRRADGSVVEDMLAKSGLLTRRVFVVAKGIPPQDIAPLQALPGDAGVREYLFVARGREDGPANSKELKEAWTAFRRQIPREEKGSETSDLVEEGLLLTAVLAGDTPPGFQPLKLQGATAFWRLIYGDCIASFDAVRLTGQGDPGEADEFEATPQLFVPEKFQLAITARTAIPGRKAIRAAFGIGDRNGKLPDEAMQTIELTLDPKNPQRYLSPPVELVRAKDLDRAKAQQPKTLVVAAEPGARLRAMIEMDPGYVVSPVSLDLPIFDTPERLSRLWKTAVFQAAKIANRPIEDWNEIVRGEAKAATNFILTEFVCNSPLTGIGAFRTAMEDFTRRADRLGVQMPLASWWRRKAGSRDEGARRIPITIGDHAAMLLLRREFVDMLREQRVDWSKNRAPAQMRAIFNAQREAIAAQQSPLSFSKIPMAGLPGAFENDLEASCALFQLFDDDYVRKKLRLAPGSQEVDDLRWRAFSRAFEAWGPAMGQAMMDAEAIPESDVLALLELTGRSFESVARRLRPELLKLEDDREFPQRMRWVPDRMARAHVMGLGVLGEAVRAQKSYSELDSTVAWAAVSIATMPLGNVGGFWTALAVLGVSVADFAHSLYSDWWLNGEREEKLAFEIGAGAVLGYSRARDANESIVRGWSQALSIGGSLLGVGADAFGVLRAVRAVKEAELVARGSKIANELDFSAPRFAKALDEEQVAVLARFAERAQDLARRVGRGALSPAERKVLDHGGAIRALSSPPAEAARAAKPVRAAAAPKWRSIGTPIETPGKIPAVPRQINDNTCGVSVVRAALARLHNKLESELDVVRRSLLSGRGYKTSIDLAKGKLINGGAYPSELVEMLEDAGITTRVPFGRKFRPAKNVPDGDPALDALRFSLDDAARELRDGNVVMASIDYARVGGKGSSPHWVTIEEVANRRITVNGKTVIDGPCVILGDPAYGTSVAIARDDFLKHWHPDATVIGVHPKNSGAPIASARPLRAASTVPIAAAKAPPIRPAGARSRSGAGLWNNADPLPHYIDEARAFLRRTGHADPEARMAELVDAADGFLVRAHRGLDPTESEKLFAELVDRLEDLSPELLQKFVRRIEYQRATGRLFLGGRIDGLVLADLDFKTTTEALRLLVRKLPYRDPTAFTKKTQLALAPLGMSLEADHIFPVAMIVNKSRSSEGLRDFWKLSRKHQELVIHNPQNFQPLESWMNGLKSNLSPREWSEAMVKAGKPPLTEDYIEYLEDAQKEMRKILQKQINDLLELQRQG